MSQFSSFQIQPISSHTSVQNSWWKGIRLFAFTFTNLSTKNLTFDRPQSLTNRTLWLVQQTRTKLNQWVSRVFPVLEAFCFNLDTFGSSLVLLLFFLCSCVFRGGRNYFGFGCSRNHLFFVDLFLLHLWSLVMKKIEFRAAAIIRIQKNVKMFMAICRHKPR